MGENYVGVFLHTTCVHVIEHWSWQYHPPFLGVCICNNIVVRECMIAVRLFNLVQDA